MTVDLGGPARSAGPLAAPSRSAPPLAAPPVRSGGRAAPALRTQRRERVPWPLLPRPRLAAAWSAVQREHAAAGAELSLMGVYGPLPLGTIDGAALDPDGRLAVTLSRRGRPAAPGDIALARVEPGHRLVRSDVPYPAAGRRAGRTR